MLSTTEMDTIIFQTTYSRDADGTISDASLNIIPCLVSSNSSYNNYQPTILTGTNADQVLKKLKSRSQEIATTYGTTTVYENG